MSSPLQGSSAYLCAVHSCQHGHTNTCLHEFLLWFFVHFTLVAHTQHLFRVQFKFECLFACKCVCVCLSHQTTSYSFHLHSLCTLMFISSLSQCLTRSSLMFIALAIKSLVSNSNRSSSGHCFLPSYCCWDCCSALEFL